MSICVVHILMSPNIALLMQQVVKIPKVNRQFLDKMRTDEEEMDADVENVDKSSIRKKKRRLEMHKALLNDPRFEIMFENKVCIPVLNLIFELNFSNPMSCFKTMT